MQELHGISSSSPISPMACLSAILFLVLLAFYGWLAVRGARHASLTTRAFGIPDALCAGILALWLIWVIAQSVGTPQVINLRVIVANSIVYGSIVAGIFGVIGFQGRSAVTDFGLMPANLLPGVKSGLLWLAATYPLILATQAVVQHFLGASDDAQQIVRYFLEHPDLKHRAAVIFMAVIVAPVAEEMIFRGYFYGVVRRYGGRIPAILTSSLLFAAIHVHLPSMLGLGILAVILCLLYERTATLWAPITMHAAFNASTIAILLIWPEMAG